jgi:O-antigen/teichoic acid export membrane protein
MLKLGLAPVIILAIAAPVLFSFVFGDQWTEAGHYVRWLSPWLLFVFVGFALAPVVLVLERQKTAMWFQGLLALGRIGSLVVGGLIGDALLAVAMFGVVSGLMWASYLAWLLIVSGVAMTRCARVIEKSVVASLVFVIPVAVCQLFFVQDLVIVGVALIGVLLAVLWPWFVENK